MLLLYYNIFLGHNFPSLGGKLNFRVKWGKELAKLEPVHLDCQSAISIIEQEAAFRTSKQDTRLLSEPIRLECLYRAPNSDKYPLKDIVLNFDQHLPVIDVNKVTKLFHYYLIH